MRQENGKRHIIHIAICDDLAEDRKRLHDLLTDYIEEKDISAIISIYKSGEEFLQSETADVDLAFLDIYMNEINGMETAKALMAKNRLAQVIFITTSPEFAAEAFSIDAFNYLMKPVERRPLFRIMDRYIDGIAAMRSVGVKVGRVEESVYLTDILYIEARGKKTLFHLTNGELEVSESLAEMKTRLAEEHFVSPIRWALVPLAGVAAVYDGGLRLKDGTEIPVSRAKKGEVREAFAAYRWATMRNAMRGRNAE